MWCNVSSSEIYSTIPVSECVADSKNDKRLNERNGSGPIVKDGAIK
jgi:hypothetical protein